MIKVIGVVLVLVVAVIAGGAYKYGFILNPSPSDPPKEKSMYEFTMNDIDGNPVKLDAYKGKVVMIVNVASKCGFTPQYEGLEAIYERYKDPGFVILGFPANNFLSQETGTEISVKGNDQHPFYTFLTNKESNPGFAGDISWNFNKFLTDRHGKVIARFDSADTPQSEKVTSAIEKALATK